MLKCGHLYQLAIDLVLVFGYLDHSGPHGYVIYIEDPHGYVIYIEDPHDGLL